MGDPHLGPRLLERARAGRLRIIGSGRNRVDMVHVENAVDAHLLADRALTQCHVLSDEKPPAAAAAPGGTCHLISDTDAGRRPVSGRAFFVTNGEPVVLWEWINALLRGAGECEVTKRIPLGMAQAVGAACEVAWRVLALRGEPPMTRFVAAELAKDHWFDITAARRDLGYSPRVSMEQGTAELIESLRSGR